MKDPRHVRPQCAFRKMNSNRMCFKRKIPQYSGFSPFAKKHTIALRIMCFQGLRIILQTRKTGKRVGIAPYLYTQGCTCQIARRLRDRPVQPEHQFRRSQVQSLEAMLVVLNQTTLDALTTQYRPLVLSMSSLSLPRSLSPGSLSLLATLLLRPFRSHQFSISATQTEAPIYPPTSSSPKAS